MRPEHRSFHTCSSDETALLAARVGARLRPGDCILLDGPIGAGKTHFCRAMIQSLLAVSEDVPSPTFTLVQTYDTPQAEIWHADLYRVTSPDDVIELGLTDAFGSAICLVEWPDRLGSLAPADCLKIRFLPDADNPDSRELSCTWSDAKWAKRLDIDHDG